MQTLSAIAGMQIHMEVSFVKNLPANNVSNTFGLRSVGISRKNRVQIVAIVRVVENHSSFKGSHVTNSKQDHSSRKSKRINKVDQLLPHQDGRVFIAVYACRNREDGSRMDTMEDVTGM